MGQAKLRKQVMGADYGKVKNPWHKDKSMLRELKELSPNEMIAAGVRKVEEGKNKFNVGQVSREIYNFLVEHGTKKEEALHALFPIPGKLPTMRMLPDGFDYEPDSECVIWNGTDYEKIKINDCKLFFCADINRGNLKEAAFATISKDILVQKGTIPDPLL